MFETMSQDYSWPSMREEAEQYVAACLPCTKAKSTKPLHDCQALVVVPETPFSVVGVDVYSPFPTMAGEDEEDRGYRYIVTIVDHYSRWVRLVPMREAPTAASIAEVVV